MWKRILDKGDSESGVSAFASFCTTMAMRVGTGNVAGITSASLAWDLADLALGSITFFNMLVVILLVKPVKEMLADYEAQMKAGKDPYYDPEKLNFKGVDVEMWKEINAKYIAANK